MPSSPTRPSAIASSIPTSARSKGKAKALEHDITHRSLPPSNRSPKRPGRPALSSRTLNHSPKRARLSDGSDSDDIERPTVQRVKFNLHHGDAEDDGSGGSDNEMEEDLLKLIQQRATQETGEGFLKPQNSADAYFLAHGKPTRTSANLFSSRPNWRAPWTVAQYLDSFDPQPMDSVKGQWDQWRTELIEGYSLLFYGLGSKRVTLNEFVERGLVNALGWEGLVVNGFQAGAHLSGLLNDLEEIVHRAGPEGTDDAGSHRPKKSNTLEALESRAQHLCEALSAQDLDLPICAVLIHNLDGLAFRNVRVQTIISLLAAQPRIHLIASIDHVHAPLLLPTHLASARPPVKNPPGHHEALGFGYNFLYHHLPTHTPYTLEALLSGTMSSLLSPTIFPATMVGSQNSKSDIRQHGPPTAKAALHVLSSLTEKAKALFRLMAEHQMRSYQSLPSVEATRIDESLKNHGQESESTPRIAMLSRSLFELARTEFVASVESQMEALLVEFRDHGVVVGSLGGPTDGAGRARVEGDRLVEDDEEWLWIALCKNDLEEVVSKIDDL